MRSVLLSLVLLGAAWAGPADPYVSALSEEMARGAEGLRLEDAAAPYHIRYTLRRGESYAVRASLGALVEEDPLERGNGLYVEVRVGDPSWDNTGFAGFRNGFRSANLPQDLTERALRQEAWRLTDRAYKDAVEHLGRKQAEVQRSPDHPGDYSAVEPLVASTAGPPPLETEGLAELVRALSGESAEGLDDLRAALFARSYTVDILDTEGGLVHFGQPELVLYVVGERVTADGQTLRDYRRWVVTGPEQLPPREALQAEVRAMRDELVALAEAPLFDEEYVGPVIFEDQAAAALFESLLLTQLEGTPPKAEAKRSFGIDFGGNRAGMRLGRRVLPPGWSAVDDPGLYPERPSSLPFDSEGRRPEAVSLVEDGVVRAALMSRAPREGMPESNGHGRSLQPGRAQGMPMQVKVTPPKRSSPRALRREALRLAEAYGRDYVLVVRRLHHDALDDGGGVRSFTLSALSEGPQLNEPVAVYRLYADGREERLRGAQFEGVQRYVLRDIVAAGAQVEEHYLASLPMGGHLAHGLATSLSAPEVLVGEVELVPAPPDPRDVPVIPMVERAATKQ